MVGTGEEGVTIWRNKVGVVVCLWMDGRMRI